MDIITGAVLGALGVLSLLWLYQCFVYWREYILQRDQLEREQLIERISNEVIHKLKKQEEVCIENYLSSGGRCFRSNFECDKF